MSTRRRRVVLAGGLGAAAAAGVFLLPGHRPDHAAAGAVSANGVTLRPAAMTLPFDDATLPARPGVEVVRGNCTGCHSAAMILSQPQLTSAQWQAEVEKMQEAYHAPVAAKDVPAVLAYLDALHSGE